MQPSLLEDGQVCVDMGPPILEGPKVPTTLEPTQVSTISLSVSTAKLLCTAQDSNRIPAWVCRHSCRNTVSGARNEQRNHACSKHAHMSLSLQGSTVVNAPLNVAGKVWLMTCVSMGNPHAVTYGTSESGIKACLNSVSNSVAGITFLYRPIQLLRTPGTHTLAVQVDDLDLAAIGPLFEKNAVFPAKINTEFVEVSCVILSL